jgi:thioredoxin 1
MTTTNNTNVATTNNIIYSLKSNAALQSFSQNHGNNLIILYFTASWCGPCKAIKPYIVEQANKFENIFINIIDVDDEDSQDFTNDLSITAMPTFIFYKNGLEVGKVVGCDKEKILSLITTFH